MTCLARRHTHNVCYYCGIHFYHTSIKTEVMPQIKSHGVEGHCKQTLLFGRMSLPALEKEILPKSWLQSEFLLDTLDEWRGTTLSSIQGVVWGRSSGRVWFHTSLDFTLVANWSEMKGQLRNGIFQEDGSLPSLMKVNPGESFSTQRERMVANWKSHR